MAGRALAPIQYSTFSAGRSATLASRNEKRPDELTVSPRSRRWTIEKRFLEGRGPKFEARAHRRELRLVVAEAAREDEAAACDRREGPDLLGDEHGIPEGQQEQAAGRCLTPLGEEPPEDRDVLVVRARRRVVITDEQGVETGLARGSGPLDHPARALSRILHRMTARQRDSDSHRLALRARA